MRNCYTDPRNLLDFVINPSITTKTHLLSAREYAVVLATDLSGSTIVSAEERMPSQLVPRGLLRGSPGRAAFVDTDLARVGKLD